MSEFSQKIQKNRMESECMNECINASLYWDKFSFKDFRTRLLLKKDTHDLAFEICVKLNEILSKSSQIIDHLKEQRDRLIKKFVEDNNVVFDDELAVKGKLLVGSGLPSILEVGMNLSRNYGLPVIPGTALKGCFSHYCKEKKILNQDDFKVVFGEDTSPQMENIRGGIIFLDAFPVERVEFGLDVVNNHFSRYYINGEIPNDWYNPIPVTYVVVAKGVFRFTLLAITDLRQDLKEKLKNAFREMLRDYGVGAKTNYSYGRFTDKA